MSNAPLAGRKIAVLVESQFIPDEIRIYRERFASYGATVELVSRLWGQPSQRFYSTVEPGVVGELQWIDVDKDVDQVAPEDYAAVIVSANYTSVRLRWSERDDVNAGNAAQVAREVPAARFFRRAMQNRAIVKGAACHGLWLLTPAPDLLAGRKVICNKVVLADVINAGGVYTPCVPGTPPEQQVVVDGDLVTNNSWHATAAFVDAIKDVVLAGPGSIADPLPPQPAPRGKRHVLVVLSEWGYWGEELVGPLEELDRAGYTVEFCTPNGKRPNAIPVSMDSDFFDPPLQRPVTTPEMAAKARRYDDPSTPEGARLQTPISLAAWFPERPYYSAPAFVRLLESYNRALEAARASIARYDAVLLVGGSGPVVDMVNNQRVHDLILAFLAAGKPIAAECYAVACLAFARDMNIRKSIVWGKHVTGHCLEYDYKDGTGFVKARNTFLDFNMGPPPYPLEFILRDATGPDGGFHGNFGHPTSVLVDFPFVTGRSTPDSTLTGRKLIEVLDGDPPLRRWGW
ncbi:type 1 glutamine amidotransferase domain-containing protein [Rhodoplanes roseus]|uniref:Thiamine biosynthesis protein ThiJ n=1 Tax=Rhodoplanes roseus TaxID=29409 RepID=A0A327KZW1_9BRAD|nr:type 1 glutamine amidotransferase domain-containing protein [Rhodoplanes roseus]RAI44229.1 thiamine biosynthesis protein ThiJ [Rhodoplanes roseus]